MKDKKIISILTIIFVIILIGIFIFVYIKNKDQLSYNTENSIEANIRQPAFAGQYYPQTKSEIEMQIDNYLLSADSATDNSIPQIVIVPHAGYIYSGPVAAYAYKILPKNHYDRIILIGRSHTTFFSGIVTDSKSAWQTPLGITQIDTEFVNLLKSDLNIIKYNTKVFDLEHSLEVELPFLQKVLGKKFKIVPLLFGNEDEDTIKNLAESLQKFISSNTLIVISTDLSHYLDYEKTNEIDKQTTDAILTNNIKSFRSKIKNVFSENNPSVSTVACAKPAVETAITLAQNLNMESKLLKYANSGDAFGNMRNKVVGYAAIAYYNPSSQANDLLNRELNQAEQKFALEIAYKTLESYFENKNYVPDVSEYPIFKTKRGAFVTLKKNDQLRGCIGNFEPNLELVEVIQNMALSAAFNDRRFTPLKQNELDKIDIELSVLSSRQKISDHNEIEVGKHGIYVQNGNKSGTYLPQVALENNWTKEQFLQSLCIEKSQIGPDCYKDGQTDLYIYTAQIF